jgi:hypothetical protein
MITQGLGKCRKVQESAGNFRKVWRGLGNLIKL